MKDSKNQFCLSRAAQSASGAPKSQFPSVPMSKLSARSIGLACLFATVVLVLTGSVSRANVIVAFDDLGLLPLDDVTNQYASSGVIFQGFTDAGGLTNIEVAGNSVFSDLHPPSPPYCLSNFYNHNSGQRARVMRILFTTPVSSISFMYDGAGSLGATTTFNVYSPAGVLLNSFHVATATDNAYHSVNVPDVNVGYLDIVNPQAGWGHYIDNLQFDANCSCGGGIAFDNLGLPALGDVTTQYGTRGVNFVGFTDAGSEVNVEVAGNSVFADINPPSPPYCLSNFYNHDSGHRARIIRMFFSTPASGIGFMYNGAGSRGASTTFNVYSPAGVLLSSFHVAAATDGAFHAVSVPDVNVGYLDIVNPQAGWGHYIDNLQFLCTGPPALSIQPAAAIRWPSVLNTPYQVQWAPRVNTNIWYNLGPPVKGSGACLTAYDMVDGGARFYRVVVNPNPAKSSLSPVLVSSGSSTSGSGETTNGGISSQPTPAPSLPLAFVPATSSPATASGEKTNRED